MRKNKNMEKWSMWQHPYIINIQSQKNLEIFFQTRTSTAKHDFVFLKRNKWENRFLRIEKNSQMWKPQNIVFFFWFLAPTSFSYPLFCLRLFGKFGCFCEVIKNLWPLYLKIHFSFRNKLVWKVLKL